MFQMMEKYMDIFMIVMYILATIGIVVGTSGIIWTIVDFNKKRKANEINQRNIR